MQAETSKQQVQALEIWIVASPSRAVAVASSRRVIPSSTRRRPRVSPLEGQSEHLEVGDAEPPPSSPRRRRARRRGRVAVRLGDVSLVEREPAVVGCRLERVQQPMGAPQPTTRDRLGAVEVELVRRQPGGHAGGATCVAALPCTDGRHAPAHRTRCRRRRATTPPSSAPREPLVSPRPPEPSRTRLSPASSARPPTRSSRRRSEAKLFPLLAVPPHR